MAASDSGDQRLEQVFLQEQARVRLSPQVEHERRAALRDLIEENHFAPLGCAQGPYILHLAVEGERLAFDIRDRNDNPLTSFRIHLGELRKIIKDYFIICDSYFKSIKMASPSRIEAIDMGRRGLHNEGAELLRTRLAERIEMDVDTARRLFTLICVLHIRA